MKIRSRLAVLMAEAPGGPLQQRHVAEATGIRPATISDIYHSLMKRLDMGVLARLCEFFDCQPGDLLECVSDEEEEERGG